MKQANFLLGVVFAIVLLFVLLHLVRRHDDDRNRIIIPIPNIQPVCPDGRPCPVPRPREMDVD